MSGRTVRDPSLLGLVESLVIPVKFHQRADGSWFTSSGTAVPVHCCDSDEVSKRATTTHPYCDIFSDELLAPLGELAYVRLDDHQAEKVFINRRKRILLTSSDGVLAQWRSAPTFKSENQYVAGAPIVNADGALVSLVTAKRGNYYAVSTFEGDGGYCETPSPWKLTSPPPNVSIYGAQWFSTHEALRAHVASLGPATVGPSTPVLHIGTSSRVVLVGVNGREIAHLYVNGVHADDVEYL